MTDFIKNTKSETFSDRGKLLLLPMRPPYQMEMFGRSFVDRFDKTSSPDGAINMLFAENQLMWREMEAKI